MRRTIMLANHTPCCRYIEKWWGVFFYIYFFIQGDLETNSYSHFACELAAHALVRLRQSRGCWVMRQHDWSDVCSLAACQTCAARLCNVQWLASTSSKCEEREKLSLCVTLDMTWLLTLLQHCMFSWWNRMRGAHNIYQNTNLKYNQTAGSCRTFQAVLKWL